MKKTCALLLFSFGWTVGAVAGELPAASSITQVTVYPDRARLTREAKVELEAGSHQILFENLPPALLEESLRADGKASARVSIKGVELKRHFAPEVSDPRVQALTQEIQKLQNELRAIQNDQQALHQQSAFLEAFRNFQNTQIPKDVLTKNPPATDWAAYSQFVLDSYKQNAAQMLTLEEAVQKKTEEISAKQQELYAIQGGSSQEKKTAAVSVEAASKTTLTLSLTYIVPQASWNISYDANVYPDQKQARLTSYGNVRQWTGEDWNGVSLTLSTAKPSIGGRMPELSPWFVDFYAPPIAYQQSRAKAARMVASEMDMAMNAAGAPASLAAEGFSEEKASLALADVSQDLGSVTYSIAGPATVLSDNRAYKFPAHQETFKAEIDYEATPKLSPYAFIHSKITNDKDLTLSAGSLSVFVDDDYIGTSSIATVGRGETFDLYLGIDEDIKVKRTELADKKKKTLLGLRARKDYAYKIELENYKKEPIRLAVYDQLPVSRNADIKTELISASPKPSETKDLQILKWNLELAPAEKKSVELQFFVEYPADKNVTGI